MLLLFTAIQTLLAMELYSALSHRFLWHGPLWRFHKSHHVGLERTAGFVPNDLLSLAHAPISMALIAASLLAPAPMAQLSLGVGIGMAAFGALYFVFHDGMVHGRLNVTPLLRFRLCRAWREAHLAHHRRFRGPFGFFASPWLMRALPGSRE